MTTLPNWQLAAHAKQFNLLPWEQAIRLFHVKQCSEGLIDGMTTPELQPFVLIFQSSEVQFGLFSCVY